MALFISICVIAVVFVIVLFVDLCTKPGNDDYENY